MKTKGTLSNDDDDDEAPSKKRRQIKWTETKFSLPLQTGE